MLARTRASCTSRRAPWSSACSRTITRTRPGAPTTPATCSAPKWPRKWLSISNPSNRVPLMTKPLNIGMIGYGFMGRAHSNAYAKVNHFCDLDYDPVLKADCARDKEKDQGHAEKWDEQPEEPHAAKAGARDDKHENGIS